MALLYKRRHAVLIAGFNFMDEWSKKRYVVEWAKVLSPLTLGVLVLFLLQRPAQIVEAEASDRELVEFVVRISQVEDLQTRLNLVHAAISALPADGAPDVRSALETLKLATEINVSDSILARVGDNISRLGVTCEDLELAISQLERDVASQRETLERLERDNLIESVDEGRALQSETSRAERIRMTEISLDEQRIRLEQICRSG